MKTAVERSWVEAAINSLLKSAGQLEITNPLDLSQLMLSQPINYLYFNQEMIGRALVKNGICFLEFDDNAPDLKISKLLPNSSLCIQTNKDLEIDLHEKVSLKALTLSAKNIRCKGPLEVKNLFVEAENNLLLEQSIHVDKGYLKAERIEQNAVVQTLESFCFEAKTLKQNNIIDAESIVFNCTDLFFSETAKTKIKHSTVFLGDKITYKGEVSLGDEVFCKVKNVEIHSPVNDLDNAYFEVEELKLEKQGGLEFRPSTDKTQNKRELQFKKLSLAQDANCAFDKTLLVGDCIESTGNFASNHCNLRLKNLSLNGTNQLQNSNLFITETFHLKSDEKSALKNLKVEAKSIVFSGENKGENLDLLADQISFTEDSNAVFSETLMDAAERIILSPTARIDFKKIRMNAADILFEGSADLESVNLESDILVSSQNVSFKKSMVKASDFWSNKGSKLESCIAAAKSTELLEPGLFRGSKLKTNQLSTYANYDFQQSKVKVLEYLFNDKEKLSFDNSILKTNQTYVQGSLDLKEKSYLETQFIQQNSGTMKIDDSTVINNGIIYQTKQAKLNIDNQSKVSVKSALIKGGAQWKESQVYTLDTLIFQGETQLEKMNVLSDKNIYFSGADQAVYESKVTAESNLILEGDFRAESAYLTGVKTIVLGQASFNNKSQLTADNLKILDKFSQKDSKLHVKELLESFYGSFIESEESVIQSKDMHFSGKIQAEKSSFKALSKIAFDGLSSSKMEMVTLDAEEEIINGKYAKIEGENLFVQTEHFENAGNFSPDGLQLTASVLHNSGTIDAKSKGVIKANRLCSNTGSINGDEVSLQALSLINAGGSIHGETNLKIQAPVLINSFGKFSSKGHLAMDNLVHLNMLGLEQAYDYNNRTILNLNYGLCLPTMPNSIDEIFTYSRMLSCLRMIASQALPGYSNLINLGSMLWTDRENLLNIANMLGDEVTNIPAYAHNLKEFFSEHSNKEILESFMQVPTKIYSTAKSSVDNYRKKIEGGDLLPISIGLMDKILKGAQYYSVLSGSKKEVENTWEKFSSFKMPSLDSFEMPSFDSFEMPSFESIQNTDYCSLGEQAGELGVKAFGPSMNNQSVFDFQGGASLSANYMESSWQTSVNTGLKCGWNMTGINKNYVNKGIFAGRHVVGSGTSFTNEGLFFAGDSAGLIYDNLLNTQSGFMNLSNFQMEGKEFVNNGTMEADNGNMDLRMLKLGEEAKTTLQSVQANIAETAMLGGNYHFGDETAVLATNIQLQGEGHLNQAVLLATKAIEQKSGSLDAEQNLIKGETVDLNNVHAKDGEIIATEKLTLKNAQTEGTTLEAKNAHLSDSTFVGRKEEGNNQPVETVSDTAAESKADLTVSEELVTERVVMEGMQAKAKSHTDSESSFLHSTLNITEDFKGQSSHFNGSHLASKGIELRQDCYAKDSSVEAEDRLLQEGSMQTENSFFHGREVDCKGLEAAGGKISADEHLRIKESATTGAGLQAKSAHLSDSTFVGFKSKEDQNNQEVSQNSNEEQPQNSANQIAVEKNLVTERVNIEGMDVFAGSHRDNDGRYQDSHLTIKKGFVGENTSFKTTCLESRDIDLTGNTKAIDSQLSAENSIKQNGLLDGQNLDAFAQTVGLKGAKLSNSFIQGEERLKVENTETVDTGLSGKNLHLKHSKFKSSQKREDQVSESTSGSQENTSDGQEKTKTNSDDPHNKIHASEALKMEDVTCEGQDIVAKEATVRNSRLKQTAVEVEKSLQASGLDAKQSTIKTGSVHFEKKTGLTDTLVESKSTAVFDKNAEVKTHNATVIAEEKILHEAKSHRHTGVLHFKADDVELSENSSIRSGSLDADKGENCLVVEAKHGRLAGKMDLDRGHIAVDKLDNLNDFIAQQGQATNKKFKQSLAITTQEKATISDNRDCDLSVTATAIELKKDYHSTHDLRLVSTEKDLNIEGDIHAKSVILQAEKESVNIAGRHVEGSEYVFIEAEKDIALSVKEKKFKGKYDVEKEYKPTTIMGGAGSQETGGAGVILSAKNKAIVDASNVGAVGKVIVSGRKGVEIKERHHTYTSSKKHRNKRFCGIKHGSKKKVEISTKVAVSNFASILDKVEIISAKGEVNGVGGNFAAAKGTDIYAKRDINLKGLITERITSKKNSSGFGLSSSKKKERHQEVTLVDFVSDGDKTRLHSRQGNIKGKDLRFRGRGDLAFEAPKGKVTLGSSKLNHKITKTKRTTKVTSPLGETAKNIGKNPKNALQQIDPSFSKMEALFKGNNTAENAANLFNFGVSAYNTMQTIQDGAFGQQFLQQMMLPKIDLSLTETKSKMQYQTASDAGIAIEGNLSFLAEGAVTLEGLPVSAENLDVDAEKLVLKGHDLKSSFDMTQNKVSIGISCQGPTDASASHTTMHTESTRYQNMPVNIRNKVRINAEEVVLDAANIDCDKLESDIGLLTIVSRQNTEKQQSQHISASTTGQVGYHQSHSESAKVNQAAGIHVHSGIDENAKVREAHLVGGYVITEGHNGFAPEKLTTEQIKDKSKSEGFGISANVNSVMKVLEGTKESKTLTTVGLSHQKGEYKAFQNATVFGEKGVNPDLQKMSPQLNTTTAETKTVVRDKAQQIQLDLPVELVKETASAGLRFFDRKPAPKPMVQPQAQLEILPEEKPETALESGLSMEENSEVSIEPGVFIEENPETTFESENYDRTSVANDTYDNQPEIEAENNNALEEHELETFSPSLKTQKLGIKNGRGDTIRLYNKENGQYTNLTKEAEQSVENNHLNASVDILLADGGSKQEGAYYQAKIDPVQQLLVLEGGVGQQYCFNITQDIIDFGKGGSLEYRIDAASAEAFIMSAAELSTTSAHANVGLSCGVMGPSASISYTSPTLSFCGFVFGLECDASVGYGCKVVASGGFEANAEKMDVKPVIKAGFFAGPGVQVTIKPTFGFDASYSEHLHQAYIEIAEQDPHFMQIIKEMEQFPYIGEWKSAYIDDVMSQVIARAQYNSWFNKP